MKLAIIEDEPLAAERLQALLHELDPAIEVMAILPSVREAVAWLPSHRPDLLLMDIHLSDGSCFAIWDRLPLTVPVIFTTAYDQYAIQAFKVNSVDYLLKPVKKEELRRSLEKYKQVHAVPALTDMAGLLESLSQAGSKYKSRFLLQFGEEIKKVDTREIAYFFAMEKSVFLTTFAKATFSLDYTLDRLEEMLDPGVFFRINRKMIINMAAIKGMHAFSRSRIKIDLNPAAPGGIESLVSIERSPAFKEWLDR